MIGLGCLLFVVTIAVIVIVIAIVAAIRVPQNLTVKLQAVESRNVIGVLLLTVLPATCHLAYGPPFYYAEPLTARVIDAKSGQPVAGAHIHVTWTLSMDGIVHPTDAARLLHESHTVSGPDGSFGIPAMLPKARPLFWYLKANQPVISFTEGRLPELSGRFRLRQAKPLVA